jgi:hypothetical protein
MKTTIELPDELAREARDFARDRGTTLRELVVEGLRSELARRTEPATTPDFRFPTYGTPGAEPLIPPEEWVEFSYGDRG